METGIYVRVSTEEQAQEGYSIRAQEQKLKDYARIKDWTIYDAYIDEGISGKNITARPAVNRMIADVKAGRVKNVLVFKIDRLTRSTSDLIFLVDLFNEHNCAFNSLMESIDTQTASGRMFLKIIGIFAEFERENIIERVTLGRERKVKEGYTLCSHTASYGYDRPNGQKIQSINEEEAQIVFEIFNWYGNQNVNITEIARRLNLRGVPTKHDSKWTTQGVRNVLRNSNYVGNVRYHYEDKERACTMEGQHEAIIEQDLFDKVVNKLGRIPKITPRKPPLDENFFTGFLVCAKCGHKLNSHNMYTKLADGTRRFHGNYECSNRMVGDCDGGCMSAKKIEVAFEEYIAGIAEFDGENSIQIDEQEQKKQERQALIATYEEKYHQLEAKTREALDFYVTNVFDIEEYRSVKSRLDSDKACVQAELERLYAESEEIIDNRVEIAKSFHKNWGQLSNIDKRMFLMQFVERIVVENEWVGKSSHNRNVKIQDVIFREMQS